LAGAIFRTGISDFSGSGSTGWGPVPSETYIRAEPPHADRIAATGANGRKIVETDLMQLINEAARWK
jgi:hypothetical protein